MFSRLIVVPIIVLLLLAQAPISAGLNAQITPEIITENVDNQPSYKLKVKISTEAENIIRATYTVTARDGSVILIDNLKENEVEELESSGSVTIKKTLDDNELQSLRETDIYIVTVEISTEGTIAGGTQTIRNYDLSPSPRVDIENNRIRPADTDYSMTLVFSDNVSYATFEYWVVATTGKTLVSRRSLSDDRLLELNDTATTSAQHRVSKSKIDWAQGFDVHVYTTRAYENENGEMIDENKEKVWYFGLVPRDDGEGYNVTPGRQDLEIDLENSNFSVIDFQHDNGIITFDYRARPKEGKSARTLSVDTPSHYERTDESYYNRVLKGYSSLVGGDALSIRQKILATVWPGYDFVNTPEYRIEIGSEVVARYDELYKGRSGWEKALIVVEGAIIVVDLLFLTHGLASLATTSSATLSMMTVSQLAKQAFGSASKVAIHLAIAGGSAAAAVATYEATSHPVEGQDTKEFITLGSTSGYTQFWADTTIQPTGGSDPNWGYDVIAWADYQLTYSGIDKVTYSMGSPHRSFASRAGGRTIIADNKLMGLWEGADVEQIVFVPSAGSIARHILEIGQTEIKTGETLLVKGREEARWLNCIGGAEDLAVADLIGESALEESYGSIISSQTAGPSRVFLNIKDVDLDYHLKGSWIIQAYQENENGSLSLVMDGENQTVEIPENGMVEISNSVRSGTLTLTVYDKDGNKLYSGTFSAQRTTRWAENGTITPENPEDDPNEIMRQDWDRMKWARRLFEGDLLPIGFATVIIVLCAILVAWRRKK